MNNDEDMNMIDPAMMLVVGSNERTLGSAGDTSVPDPLHPECTVTFHCDLHGQHCTSTRTCPGGALVAKAVGAGVVVKMTAPDGSKWVCEPQQCRWVVDHFECDPPVCRPA